MKKNDWILVGIVLVIALACYLINSFVIHSSGASVTVTVNGEVYGTYALSEEQEIDINGTNHLSIRNGKADMTDADCPDKLCVHQRAISRDRETIVCLPNRIVVEVTGAKEPSFDSIAK